MNNLSETIRSIPDFPKQGIMFRDITTLLKDPAALRQAVHLISTRYENSGIDKVVCIESRGFILGSAVAVELGAGCTDSKKGKLPAAVIREEYALEYGTDTISFNINGNLLPTKSKLKYIRIFIFEANLHVSLTNKQSYLTKFR